MLCPICHTVHPSPELWQLLLPLPLAPARLRRLPSQTDHTHRHTLHTTAEVTKRGHNNTQYLRTDPVHFRWLSPPSPTFRWGWLMRSKTEQDGFRQTCCAAGRDRCSALSDPHRNGAVRCYSDGYSAVGSGLFTPLQHSPEPVVRLRAHALQSLRRCLSALFAGTAAILELKRCVSPRLSLATFLRSLITTCSDAC